MKRTLLIFTFIFLIVSLTACIEGKDIEINTMEKSPYDTLQENEEIIIEIDEEVNKDTEIINVKLFNNSEKEYTYGKDHHLEKIIDNEWYVVSLLDNAVWEDIGLVSPAKSCSEIEFNIKFFYGKLDSGKYRIVKSLYSDGEPTVVFAEFEIEW